MRDTRSPKRRWGSLATTVALVAAGLVATVAAATPAAADLSPIAPRSSTVPTADALPTTQVDGVVWSQAITGTGANALVWAGGKFTNARPAGAAAGTALTARSNLLAYNLATGNLVTTFAVNPTLNGTVQVVAASPDGTRIYVGGDFTIANGVTHNRLVAFNASTGALIPGFNVNLGGQVKAIAATNTTVYVGGPFSSANGVTRTRLAAFNASNGGLTGWAPAADYNVTAMVLTPGASPKLIVGGAFANVNGSPAYGLAAIDTAGALQPWAANALVQDGGTKAGITSLTTDGTSIFGTGYVFGPGGNLEGTFSADPATGTVNWIEDCHGDTYSSYPTGTVVYTVSHAHYCGNVGGFPQSTPWGTNMRHALAFTNAVTGTIGHDPLGYHDWFGNPSPSLINWFPDFTTGKFTGQNQAGWSVTGNGQYVVIGGEFPTVNGAPAQGLTRFALRTIAPGKSGPMATGAHSTPTLVSFAAGTVRVAFPSNWDRDDKTLTYKVTRDRGAIPVYTTTGDSTFWNRPPLGFVDTGLAPGSTHLYRLFVSDPDGNTVSDNNVSITLPATSTTSAFVNDVKAAGASHYWRLGEPSGTSIYDWAGFDDAATSAVGVVGRGVAGAINGDADTASSFDGTSFAVNSASVTGPNVFTESAWFKTNTVSGGKIIGFGNNNVGNSTSYDRHIYMDNSGFVYFGVYNNGSFTVKSTRALNDGQWHQVIGTLSPAGMTFFIDGKRVGTNAGTTVGQAYPGYWRIGGDSSWAGGNYFNGSIDEAAIYPTALSLAQVQQQFVDSGRTFPGITPPGDNYGKAVYGDNPTLYYRLDETGGTVVTDASGNQNDGASFGNVVEGVASPVSGATGTADSFDGVTGTGIGSNATVTGPSVYSEELWFKTTTAAGGKLIGFGNNQSGNSTNYDRHVYMLTTGQLVFGTYTGQLNLATSTASYNDGTWHHLVATQGAGGMKLYLDNALAATNAQTGAQGYSGHWRIGGDTPWSASGYFNGTIDEVAVYDTVLTPAQIAAHYNAASGVNRAPKAAFTATPTGLSVAFDGTGSTDADGSVASYAWDFGDGSTGTGVSPTHAYAAGGTFTASLTVTDNLGAVSTAVTHAVTTANSPPTAAFTFAATALNVVFDGSTSADSDGTVASHAWDFGDGGTSAVAKPSHKFGISGSYNVKLTVTDNLGATNSVTQSVTVAAAANVPPVAQFSSTPTNLSVAFDGSASADPDGTVAAFSWNFGDSSVAAVPTPTHVYAGPGTYQVMLTVTDDSGATNSITKAVTVTAANVAPTAAFTTAATNLNLSVDGSASTDSDGTVTSYAWTFGDGTTATGATTSHTYAAAGTFTVSLIVKDNSAAASAAVTHQVTVTAPVNPVVATDTFGRTLTNQLGTADAGGAWTLVGTSTLFGVAGGVGTVKLATAGTGPSAYLNGAVGANVNGTVDVSLSAAATGTGTYVSLAARRTGTSDYRIRVRTLPTSTTISVNKIVGGVETVIKTVTVAGMTYNLGDTLRMRIQVVGSGTSTISGKVWKTSAAEPAAWQVSATDAEPTLQGSGGIGFTTYLSTTSTAPVTVSLDNLSITTSTTP